MKRCSILGLTFLVLVCAPEIFGFKEEDPEWMRDVTPAGQPRVDVTLATSDRSGLFEKLTLAHQLRFDGVRYQSKLSIVELESHLVPKGVARYEWRTPTGKVIVIDMAAGTNSTPNKWKVVRSVGEGEVAVVGGSKEVYVYRKSRLVEYEKAGARYFLNLREGVSEVLDKRGVALIRLTEGDAGSQTLSAFGSTMTLHYGENRELRRCSGGKWAELEFFYDSGLLTGFRQGDAWRRFAWGAAKHARYEKPEKKVPPVVVVHDRYKFEYTATGQILTGAAYSEGTELGTWNFSYKTERHRITSREKDHASPMSRPDNDGLAQP